MTRLNDSGLPTSLLHFYSTAAYPCSYLPGRTAHSLVAIPPEMITTGIYSDLVRSGFRRSGDFTYRPACNGCAACVPVRVPVEHLTLNRSQRRCLAANRSLIASEHPLSFNEEHFRLYVRYQAGRHAGGGMDDSNREQYAEFLLKSRVDTRLIAFHEDGALRMVSVIDVLDDGLSSVYTFFDPDAARNSPGTYNILWQIGRCRALNLPYLYLGYWIGDCRKMSYKAHFQPIEGLTAQGWRLLDPVTTTPPA